TTMRFILRRVIFYLSAAWASITLNFLLPRLMPGDPALAVFGRFQGKVDPSALESMRDAYGVSDASLLSQYFSYLGNLARGEFGTSISYFPSPVIEVIGIGLSWTLLLGITALVLSTTIGTLVGIVGAWNRGRPVDSVVPPTVM